MKTADMAVTLIDHNTGTWNEDTYWDGNNHISKATGSQWHHQRLYRSRKGRYYIEHTSNYQGYVDRVEWISHRLACAWLLNNSEELPEELEQYRDQVEE
jgi:hypothetical protein